MRPLHRRLVRRRLRTAVESHVAHARRDLLDARLGLPAGSGVHAIRRLVPTDARSWTRVLRSSIPLRRLLLLLRSVVAPAISGLLICWLWISLLLETLLLETLLFRSCVSFVPSSHAGKGASCWRLRVGPSPKVVCLSGILSPLPASSTRLRLTVCRWRRRGGASGATSLLGRSIPLLRVALLSHQAGVCSR